MVEHRISLVAALMMVRESVFAKLEAGACLPRYSAVVVVVASRTAVMPSRAPFQAETP